MSGPRASVYALVALLALSVVPAFATASIPLSRGGAAFHDSVTSTNWSGYAVTGSSGSVTDVKGSWIVPTIQGTCTGTAQYSSHWVGIDGYSSNTVEQTGTDSDCQGGAPAYYAWYEFYPKPSFSFSALTVRPGDKIFAEVTHSGNSFTVTITDLTTGHSASKTAKVNGAKASSAEWITEAPSGSGGILPLANFGTISWGTDYTAKAGTNYATVSGVTGPIGSFGPNVHQITMVTSGGATKAKPSSLSSDGTSFTVGWVSAGP